MTPEDAHMVGLIAIGTHGECYVCGADLIAELIRVFPERRADFVAAWLTKHDLATLKAVSTTVETWKVPLRGVHWIQEVSSGVTPAFAPDAYGDAAGDAAQFRQALALIAANAVMDPVAFAQATLASTRVVPEGTDR